MLTFEQLPPEAAEELWRSFAVAIGMKTMRAAYGPAWPRRVAHGERVWRVRDESLTICAWLSLREDPVEPWVWYAAGVWPSWQRRGIVHGMRAWARSWINCWPCLRGLVIEVLDTNAEWQKAMLREVERGDSILRLAGRIEIPGAEAQLFWIPKEE